MKGFHSRNVNVLLNVAYFRRDQPIVKQRARHLRSIIPKLATAFPYQKAPAAPLLRTLGGVVCAWDFSLNEVPMIFDMRCDYA